MRQNQSLILTSSALLVAFLFTIGGVPLAFASTGSSIGSGNTAATYVRAAPALTTVSVTLTFSPKTVKGAPGATVENDVTIKNTGATSITFTGCILEIKLSTSKTYSTGSCSLSADIPVAAGQSVEYGWDTSISTTATKGTYNIRIYLTTSTDESKAGTYNLDVS